MIKSGRPIIFGDGENLRSMSYIDNVIQAMLLAERTPHAAGNVYWVADERPYKTIEIYETIARILGVRIRPKYLPGAISVMCEAADSVLQSAGFYSPEIHVAGEMNVDIACSIEKAKKELGYAPAVDLAEGMRRSVEWCRKQGIDI
jgi:nucleoside-diphosphate-sugar epimerase